jgi:hypothetical protein
MISEPGEAVPRDDTTELLTFGLRPMSEVTHILHAIAEGDPRAASQFLPLVYGHSVAPSNLTG